MKARIQINSDAISLRRDMGEDATSPIDVFSLIGSMHDLTVVYHPMSDNISGMSIKDNNIKLIAINSRLSKGRQRFTAAHELCHLFIHKDFKTIICSKDLVGTRNNLEKEADQFASFFLAPYEAFISYINKDLNRLGKKITMEDVVRIEQYFGMSRQSTLVRLQSEKLISESEAASFKSNVIKTAKLLGYSTDLYQATPPEKQHLTIGSYIRIADKLHTEEKISSGKYEELLLDAFRADIVYVNDTLEEHYD